MLRFVKRLVPDRVKMFLKIPARLAEVERRTLNLRQGAIDLIFNYLVSAELPGDYCEFGVAQGRTFSYAYKKMSKRPWKMRFIAFDSFEGLPQPAGVDAEEGFTSGFFAGQYATSEPQFRENLRKNGVDLNRVHTVQGWFDKTLAPGGPGEAVGIEKVALAWVDGDLYESTVPILDFLTHRLSVGTVIVFDDWRNWRNLPDHGEQRACKEWLEKNPQIILYPYFQFASFGQVFTVGAC